MDELPTIKKLSKIQLLLKEALKSAPPLMIMNPKDSDFIVFNHNKNNTSIIDRLLNHKTIKPLNGESRDQKCGSTQRWSQLKNNITQELETKRMENEKHREINNKLENEELLDEDNEEVVDEDNEEVVDEDNEEVVDEDNEEVANEDIDDNNDCNDEQNSGSDCDDIEDKSEEEVESNDENDSNGSDRFLNPFIDNEAEEDYEECEQTFDYNKSKQFCNNSEKDLTFLRETETNDNINEKKSQSLAEEECDNLVNDNGFDTSFNSLDESFDRKFATQKIALSPFLTQKRRSDSKQEFSEFLSKESNAEEFDSQILLGLCSGVFANDKINNENEEQNKDLNKEIQLFDNQNEDIFESLNSYKKSRKIFNIESDSESDSDHLDSKSTNSPKMENKILFPVKDLSESESEILFDSEAEEEEDNEVEEDIEKIRKSFFDEEAVLSSNDEASSDEEDIEGDYEDEVVDNEELPSDSELRDQNERFHNKKVLDEDKRQLMAMKEMLFEDGDLFDDGTARQKKFRWNFEETDDFMNDYVNEDSDNDYIDSDDEQNIKTPVLKMFDNENKSTQNNNFEKNKLKFNPNICFKDSKNNSLSSFLVRDKRLNTILSKRTLGPKSHSIRQTKKLKSLKNNKISVFDLLNHN